MLMAQISKKDFYRGKGTNPSSTSSTKVVHLVLHRMKGMNGITQPQRKID